MSRPLQSNAKAALMFGARARLSAGFYPCAIGEVTPQLDGILVINDADFFNAEGADAAPAEAAWTPIPAL